MRNKANINVDDSVFLSKLVLWKNDPGLIEEIFPHARAGNVTAQYALGLIYAEGRGVEQDNKQALFMAESRI